jgi:hypothetical protein
MMVVYSNMDSILITYKLRYCNIDYILIKLHTR